MRDLPEKQEFGKKTGRLMMKSLYGLIMVALFSFSLCGCGLVDKIKDKIFPGAETEAEEPDPGQYRQNPEAEPVIVINASDIKVDFAADVTPTPSPTPFVYEEIYDDENKTYSKETKSLEEVVLTFIGDISFAEGFANMNSLYAGQNGILGCIKPEVIEGLNDCDIFFANNEFPYSSRGSATQGKKFTFRAKPENVSFLHEIGVDIVSLGNNHAYDFGPDALMDTFDILEEAKIPYVGAGRNISEAMKPVYYKVNGRTIAFTSATQIERFSNPDTKEATEDSPGVLRTLDPSRMLTCIRDAEENSDFVVVYVHWGSENTDLVDDSQKKLAADYVAAGADLIIGDHSHCLQGIDYVEGVPVIYSLGNFWFNSRTIDTGFVRVVLDTPQSPDEAVRVRSFEFVPCIQRGCRTYLADEEEKERILSYLQGISRYALVNPDGSVEPSDTNHNIQNGANTSPSRQFLNNNNTENNSEAGEAETPPVDPMTELLLQQQAILEQMAQGEAASEPSEGGL